MTNNLHDDQVINEIASASPKNVDLTNAKQSEDLIHTVETLLEEFHSLSEIADIERQLIDQNDASLIFILLALKIAKSKIILSRINKPLTISVVFAVYKEHNRIKEKKDHQHGEDFLRRKVAQLEWLFGDHPTINWQLIVVDDGCPENSGKIALDIVNKNTLNKNVKVLFLSEAIEHALPISQGLTSVSDSQKGGSIAYGMWYAATQSKGDHDIIVFTDADLSTHLGQMGLLMEPLMNGDKSVAIGSRREPDSVVIKKGARNNRGKLFIYLWKRLIPNLGEIIDTQCGFKAFRRDIVIEIIEDLLEKKFAFDIELLIKAELIRKHSIAKVAVAWIDSEAASTTTDLQPYLPMLKSIVGMYRKYIPSNEQSDIFAAFIESLTTEDFDAILNHIPAGITSREPHEFTTYDAITVSDLLESKLTAL